jgi:hypothetical protein
MTAAHPHPAPDAAHVLRKALLRAAQRLGLAQKDLGEIVGLSAASVSRLSSGGLVLEPDSKQGELALLFLRMFRSLDAVVGGDEDKARAWFFAPNIHVAGVPNERARTVEGLVDVVQYLDAVRGHL